MPARLSRIGPQAAALHFSLKIRRRIPFCRNMTRLPPPPKVPHDIDRMLDGSYAGRLSAKARARLAEQAGGDNPTEIQY